MLGHMNSGVDFTSPLCIKYEFEVHLELVTDVMVNALLTCFTTCCCKPSLIWSDHSTDFIDANRELWKIAEFLKHQKMQAVISNKSSRSLHLNIPLILVVSECPEHLPPRYATVNSSIPNTGTNTLWLEIIQ